MNKMGKNTLFQAILVMAGMLTACGGSSQKDEKEQVKYEIQVMKPESRVYNLYIPAALHGVSEVEVFPQVSGIIREVNFKDGIMVTKGQMNIFGQVTSRKRQARARKQMEEDYKQAVRTNLAANVAATYFNLIMYDRELKILQETQVVWEESLEAMRVLFEAGLYMSPAVYQMEASLASVQSGIVEVQENIRITEAALCLLLSEPPHPIERAQFGKFVMPEQLHVGLPIRLLEARPDVRQAARNIEVAYYDVQQARQSFYPDITINATLGWSNGEGAINPAQFLAQAIGSLAQPFFSQGRLKARYKNAKIDQEKARLQFTQILLTAGNEVYRHLRICHKTEQKAAYLASIVQSLNEAYVGTRELMNNGTNTYVEVLKSQEDLLTAQITEVQNHFEGIQAFINLYTALGGF